MSETILHLVSGFLALLVGGEALVRGSVGLARQWRVPPLLIGLTVVSIGTSAPELVVSLLSAAEGHTDMALGNVVGSNICNIGLILGLVATIKPLEVKQQLVVREAPILLAATGLVLLMLMDRQLGTLEGSVLLVSLVLYLVLAFRGERELDLSKEALPGNELKGHPAVSLMLVLGGMLGLFIGGEWLVNGAVSLAEAAGLSKAVIAVTIIAAGTSLPELVASLIALRSGEADLAIGNVIGSNLFNLFGILGLTSISYGVDMKTVSWFDMGFMGLLTVVLVPMVVTARRLERWEGLALLLAYAGYVLWSLSS